MRNRDLIKQLTRMEDIELQSFIRELRSARSSYVENSKKPAAQRIKKSSNKLLDLLEGMSDEDKAKLMEELGG